MTVGAVLMFLGVAAGAFGAHGLRGVVTPERMAVYEKAVFYHLVHALSVVVVAAAPGLPGRGARVAVWAFVTGVVIFSGSLYLLVLTDRGWLGAVTPLGGLSFLVGWAVLAAAAFGRP